MALPKNFKKPGVYINENNAFPNSIAAVETAVPVFIGYTEKSTYNNQSLLNTPIKINSFEDFEHYFGVGFTTTYTLEVVSERSENPINYDLIVQNKAYSLTEDANTRFNLHDAMKLFYQNGGGSCFIISVGTYGANKIVPDFTSEPFMKGILVLEKETEPTMLIIPDAVLLDAENCYSLQEQMLMHCGEYMNKVAILDIHSGDKGLNDPNFNPIDTFRNGVASSFLSYGVAYYPWLNTTILQLDEVSYKNLNATSITILKTICKNFVDSNLSQQQKEKLNPYIKSLSEPEQKEITPSSINNALNHVVSDYTLIMEAILKKKNVLPPAAAIAGIYTLVDATSGVWKAPANVGVSSVVSPVVNIDKKQQEDLNAPVLGKAVCAIRSFNGLGTLVWGARTLDGNGLDFRYINVRRTIIMLEQSIILAVKGYVFEPNDKKTWDSIKSMITNFLSNLWKEGALAGSTSEDAFNVGVGLGITMTATDIKEGILRIEIKVAISHPAEFMALSIKQQMQQS